MYKNTIQPDSRTSPSFAFAAASHYRRPAACMQPPVNITYASLSVSSDPYNPVRGETALWQAVITQALMDASTNSVKPDARYIRHNALNWLLSRGKDFVTVCHNAGLEPEDVRRKAVEALKRGCKWRAEPEKEPAV